MPNRKLPKKACPRTTGQKPLNFGETSCKRNRRPKGAKPSITPNNVETTQVAAWRCMRVRTAKLNPTVRKTVMATRTNVCETGPRGRISVKAASSPNKPCGRNPAVPAASRGGIPNASLKLSFLLGYTHSSFDFVAIHQPFFRLISRPEKVHIDLRISPIPSRSSLTEIDRLYKSAKHLSCGGISSTKGLIS